MAKELRDRGGVDEAGVLCTFLLVDEKAAAVLAAQQAQGALSQGVVSPDSVCWVSDMVLPGGRHDNDHVNFRNIQILPTVNELECEVASYLPLANGKNRFIDDPVTSLLDSNFRLLREDAISTMRETLRDNSNRLKWANARIIGLDAGSRLGGWAVSLMVQCDIRRGGNPNWSKSRTFSIGTVVALCRNNRIVRLGTVTIREPSRTWLNSFGGPVIGVVFDDDFEACLGELVHNSYFTEQHNEILKEDLSLPLSRRLSRSSLSVQKMQTYDLIEISKSFFSYRSILKALQGKESAPLLSDLAKASCDVSKEPDYLPDKVTLPLDFGGCEVNAMSIDDVVESTSLDKSQADAIHHALSNNIALIQGPPGTGKSYIGSLVARTVRRNTDESVLCVCYTNHALDQFLENMLATGETRLVRIGSRSKSEKLNAYSLHNLARRTSGGQIGDSQHRIRQVTAQLFALKDLIEKAVVRLLSPCKWDEVRVYLSSDEPRQLPFLQVPASRDGYRIVDSAGKIVGDKYLWELWCSGAALPQWLLPHVAIQEEDYPLFQQFWQLPHEERETRARGWKTDMRQGQVTSILHLTKELDALAQELKTLSHDRESTILKQARIIGATTPGAATYRDLLSVVPPKVVIVEEAGEVLEAHILTSLATTCEHLIMIGDHLQLPPKVEQYNLTAASGHGYKLDCSLFERLVKQSWQSVSLQVQHRMRPSISAFVRAQTYPSLKDHDSVLDYPNVTGVMKNVVFVDHRHPEDWDDNNESKTKSNSSEARLVLEIIRFLLLQGYAANRIVVLTPYVGQLIQLVGLIQQDLKEATAAVGERDLADVALLSANDSIVLDDANAKGVAEAVRCSSIDNFQGEESDIIVASLVRSSARGAIGFLKEPQRVNVLLSRARLGLFLVGNSDTLLATRAGRTVWGPVLRRLRENEGIVKGFPTFCQLHPEDDPIILKEPSDFRAFRLNGGCTRACSVRLDCGHPCPLLCHPADRSHTRAQLLCCEPCKRFPPNCQNQHACPKLCKEKCGRCMAFVGSRLLPCDHVSADVRCYEEHELKPEKLIQELSRRCVAKVSFTFPKCRHEASLTCLESRDPELICQSTCQETAQCGHLCKKRCGPCASTRDHLCDHKCDKLLFCGHLCGRVCHAPNPCAPCEASCQNRCPHSSCGKACHEPCASCVEPCDWICEHNLKCPLVCGAPCSRLPCNVRCSKRLACGHRCPSLCGEECPDVVFCHECSGVNRKKVVDMICFTTYEDHDVDNDPVIVLPCHHFFAASTLDGHLQIKLVYEMSGASFTGLKSLVGSSLTGNGKQQQCPECRAIIHSVRRYGRVLRLMELRSLERKHVMMAESALAQQATLVTEQTASQDVLTSLQRLEHFIRKSPMTKVFEACDGVMDIAVPPPPPGPLIRCLELQGIAYAGISASYEDVNYVKAKAFFEQGILLADDTLSNRSGAQLRLALSYLVSKHCRNADLAKDMVIPLVDWILDHPVRFEDLISRAQDLKSKVLEMGPLMHEELKEIVIAMSSSGGYNYGGAASSHWYECPNGHPFFIGECGGAVQTSMCHECGAEIGGRNHSLLQTNRRVTGALLDALS